jgi:F-type H+-transporting ATPase subunit b
MRSSRRIFWFAILIMFAVALATTPRALRAQDSASAAAPAAAAQTAPAVQPSAAAFQQAANSEKHDDDVYLHAPIIKSIAKALHMDLATTSWLFVAFNFLILVLAIGIPVVRIFPRIIRKRSQTLKHNLETARQETADANARLSAVEARLASLDDEIAKYRAEVDQEIVRDEARIKALLEEEKTRIVAGAEQEIGSAAAQARRGLRSFAAELAVDHAASQLKLTPETDQALIAEFVHDMAGRASREGQN